MAANRELSLLMHIFEYAQVWGYRTDNPAAPAKKLKELPRRRYVTDKEFLAVYDAGGARGNAPGVAHRTKGRGSAPHDAPAAHCRRHLLRTREGRQAPAGGMIIEAACGSAVLVEVAGH